jgi:hypothetical protein
LLDGFQVHVLVFSRIQREDVMARRLLAVLVPAVLILSPVAEAQVTVRVPDVVGKKMGARSGSFDRPISRLG